MSSKNSTSNWKLSVRAINMSNSFLGETLAPLYDIHAKNLLYIMYNDEPPFKAASSVFGHSKGVVVTDGQVGMWLIHSTPKFPIETFRSLDSSTLFERKNKTYKYFFPLSGKKYGQSFLCITLTSSQMNKVGIALQYIRPKVYDFNVPVDLNKQFANLSAVAKNEYIKQAPWYIKTVLESQGGTEFVSYAKAKQFNKDLYNDWLTEDLQSSLQVETWSNGPNYLPSNCKKKFHVMDVEDIQIRAADNQTVSFKNSQDHSKWAVTFNNNASIVCIGDINRMVRNLKAYLNFQCTIFSL